MGIKKRLDPIFQTRNRLLVKHRGEVIGEVYTLRNWYAKPVRRRGRRSR
ncbi:hypothetical protein [Paenibacillus hemerocallicola]|nr:hypothetical protein [Paenibacillus hemerocallicola]